MGQDPDDKPVDQADDEQPDKQQLVVEQPEYPSIGVVEVAEGENPDV